MPVYIYLMEDKNTLNPEIVVRHIDHLRFLDQTGSLVLCGPFTDYPGGMVVLRTADHLEALRIAQSDPFIAEGYKTFQLRTLEVADASNAYLGT
ncbi:MAG: YciI family protein [Erysipelotrichaceae bacterium]